MTQFGPTPRVYRQPHDLATARVFSDPPLNTIGAEKAGAALTLATGARGRAAAAFAHVRRTGLYRRLPRRIT